MLPIGLEHSVCYVTNFALHKSLKLIACGKLTFDGWGSPVLPVGREVLLLGPEKAECEDLVQRLQEKHPWCREREKEARQRQQVTSPHTVQGLSSW